MSANILKRMMDSEIRIMLTGGGTGGHVFPALAVADAIKARYPNAQFLFVGAEGKMEMERVPQAGYKIIGLPVAGFDVAGFYAAHNQVHTGKVIGVRL